MPTNLLDALVILRHTIGSHTGVVAAVVMSLLGVTEAAIVDDYLASATNMPRMVDRFMSWPRYRDHLSPPCVSQWLHY